MIIYKTTCLKNGKIYVGKDSHNNPSYYGSGLLLVKAIKKYGKHNFKKEILEFCNVSNINEREIYWISQLNAMSHDIGYNRTPGGDGCGSGVLNHFYGKHHSKKTRKLMKLKKVGFKPPPLSQETRDRMSRMMIGRTRTFSEEHKRKLSIASSRPRGIRGPYRKTVIKQLVKVMNTYILSKEC